MARDPRADFIDDSPFPDSNTVYRVHSHQDPSGTIHVNLQSPFSTADKTLWGVQFQQPITHHKGDLWHFSEEEKNHLLLATFAFTIALGLMRVRGVLGISFFGMNSWALQLLLSMPVMLFAVGPAFLLHEIGHKIVAKYYGCWAEFRSDPQGLKVGVGIAALLGFVFMAPGAVMVAGTVTRRQNGHIAIAGPLVNLSLFLIGIPLGALVYTLLGGSVPSSNSYLVEGGFDWHVMLWDCISFWVTANLILGLFNMLPFGPLDGVKVRDWSYGAWLSLTLVFTLPLVAWMFTPWSPMDLAIGLASLWM